jgi:hypothetical protein
MLKELFRKWFRNEPNTGTPQQQLVRFCKRKAVLLEFPAYFNEGDKEELKTWDDKIANAVIDQMFLSGNDNEMCPWCVHQTITKGACSECGYADRHLECGSKGSTYRMETACRTPLIQRLSEEQREELYKILNGIEEE